MPFEIAGGSVAGRAHVVAGRNNQDALCWVSNDDGLVAVVCDGCGSGPHSEVGAQVGARLIVQAAVRLLRTGADEPDLERVRQDVLASLRMLAHGMSVEGAPSQGPAPAATFTRTVADHFLFTVVGLVITARRATTFSLGDGLVTINGERTQFGPFPDNEPPYLGYALLPDTRARKASEGLSFKVHRSMAPSDVQSIVLGTDGAIDLEVAVERQNQGRGEPVGPLSQFWTDDRFFKNSDMVRRRLAVLNRGPRAGLLSDDTTLMIVRRKAEG